MIKKDETLKLKNELEKVRFSKDVIDNPNLVRILDRTIDQAENNQIKNLENNVENIDRARLLLTLLNKDELESFFNTNIKIFSI